MKDLKKRQYTQFFYIMQIFVFWELFCITASVQFLGIWTKVPGSDEHDEVFCAREDGCVWGWRPTVKHRQNRSG
ncbi:MAG: hypothetical protein B2I17_08290 [Thermoplasmatales archaeon B_DKE]|nr:MAG: hypothetical protein B2I17_08290 [Thermoplasmatales archaeon B_DKE]